MGLIDRFDYLTAINSGLRRARRGAHQALEHWLLRVVYVNMYVWLQIWRRESGLQPFRSQVELRESLIEGLIDLIEKAGRDAPIHPMKTISHRKEPGSNAEDIPFRLHRWIKMLKRKKCYWYKGGRPTNRPMKRVPLGVISNCENRISKRSDTSFRCE